MSDDTRVVQKGAFVGATEGLSGLDDTPKTRFHTD
jgi:hypothetical protein